MKAELYERITAKIVADLKKGVRPWFKPWSNEQFAGRVSKPLRANGQSYSGINILLLWCRAMEEGFSSPIWLTFKQAAEYKATVRRGEKGSLVVYAAKVPKPVQDGEEDDDGPCVTFLRHYTVFNVEQIDGLPPKFRAKTPARIEPKQRRERADAFVSATRAEIRHGGNQAFYAPGPDRVHMPPFESFLNAEGYYATIMHELAHWTGHKSRLDRNLIENAHSVDGRAMEELVAELGSAFVCADLDISPDARSDHAAYIGSWLKVLKHNPRAIFSAAALAQRAAEHLNSYSSHGLI